MRDRWSRERAHVRHQLGGHDAALRPDAGVGAATGGIDAQSVSTIECRARASSVGGSTCRIGITTPAEVRAGCAAATWSVTCGLREPSAVLATLSPADNTGMS